MRFSKTGNGKTAASNDSFLKDVNSIASCSAYKERIAKFILENELETVLDVGCGNAEFLKRLSKYRMKESLYGVDINKYLLQLANRSAGKKASLICASACSLPFRTRSFDALVLDRVIQHTKAPDQFVINLLPFLNDQGFMVCADADWSTLEIRGVETELVVAFKEFLHDTVLTSRAGAIAESVLFEHGQSIVKRDCWELKLNDLAAANRILDLENQILIAKERGFFSDKGANQLLSSIHELDRQNAFRCSNLGFITYAKVKSN